jgi:hypothetical protein
MSEPFKLGQFIPELDTPFVFNKRPIAIAPDLRPEWRIGVTLLLLKICCRQNRSSYGRLHLLSWAVRTEKTRADFLRTAEGTSQPDTLLVRIEPSLNRAVNLAIGEELLKSVNGDRIELTTKGGVMAEAMLAHEGLFEVEKSFFRRIRSVVTEDFVGRLYRIGLD